MRILLGYKSHTLAHVDFSFTSSEGFVRFYPHEVLLQSPVISRLGYWSSAFEHNWTSATKTERSLVSSFQDINEDLGLFYVLALG